MPGRRGQAPLDPALLHRLNYSASSHECAGPIHISPVSAPYPGHLSGSALAVRHPRRNPPRRPHLRWPHPPAEYGRRQDNHQREDRIRAIEHVFRHGIFRGGFPCFATHHVFMADLQAGIMPEPGVWVIGSERVISGWNVRPVYNILPQLGGDALLRVCLECYTEKKSD